jgi:hypothetical protein
MYLAAKPPNMLPTQILTGRNATGQTITRKRSFVDIIKRTNAASPRSESAFGLGRWAVVGVLVPVVGVAMTLL